MVANSSQGPEAETRANEHTARTPTDIFGSLVSYGSDADWSWASTYTFTTSEALAEFSDAWGYTSYPCVPATLIDIPEVKSVAAKFVYKYYTKDERTSGAGQYSSIDVSDMSQADEYISNNTSNPRYVQFSVTPTTFTNPDTSLQSMLDAMGPTPIKSNLSKLHTEDAVAANYFASVYLKDDQIDQEFYTGLSGSMSFFGLDDTSSGGSGAEELEAFLTGTTSFSRDGVQVKMSMGNIQSQGVAYAPTDVREEDSSDIFSSVKNIDFGMALNNKLAYNLVASAVEDKTNIYENEIEGLMQDAKTIQDAAIASNIPGLITADEFDVSISNTLDETIIEGECAEFLDENSLPIGFIIEKWELSSDSEGNAVRTDYDPIVVEGYNATHILDPDIKYGASYVYNIRTVALTRFEAFTQDPSGEVQDQTVFATVMMASAGLSVKVDCHENIPPNPPQNLRFQWDYTDNTLMLFWEEELNPQRDVVRYQIFRRKSIDVPFTLIKEFNFDQSTSKVTPLENSPSSLQVNHRGPRKVYKDRGFDMDSSYIYALSAIDARGLSANYSAQFRVEFDRSRNKLKVDLVSRSNAPKPYPNLYLNTDLFVDTMKDSGHSRMRIFFDPEYFDVYETRSVTTDTGGTPMTSTETESLGLLGSNYKLQIINVDSQLSEVVNINVISDYGLPDVVPTSYGSSDLF